jgi:hypothetical protein
MWRGILERAQQAPTCSSKAKQNVKGQQCHWGSQIPVLQKTNKNKIHLGAFLNRAILTSTGAKLGTSMVMILTRFLFASQLL